MSLDTLLEAALFVELQEQQKLREEAEHRQRPPDHAPILSNGPSRIEGGVVTHNGVGGSSSSSGSIQYHYERRGDSPPVLHIAQGKGAKQVYQLTTTSPSPLDSPAQHPASSPTITSSSTYKTIAPRLAPPSGGVVEFFPCKSPPEQQPQVSSTVPNGGGAIGHFISNSFDIVNVPLIIDEGGNPDSSNGSTGGKRKQPPMVFRAGTREVHNKLEKDRRAHLKECFDALKKQLPQAPDEKKTSNLSILHSALKFIQVLKRRERDLEHEMERLARDKISLQQRLMTLKKDHNISCACEHMDLLRLIPETPRDTPIPPDTIIVSEQPSLVKDEIDIKSEFGEEMVDDEEKCSSPKHLKEVSTQQALPTAVSVLPVGYPVGQSLVLQKLIVPKGLTDIAPLVSTHFITTAPQQLNGKVAVPIVNAQYVVKPVVVVSTASARPS